MNLDSEEVAKNSEDEEEITEGDSDKEVPINLIINANYQKLVGSKYFFVPDTENDNFDPIIVDDCHIEGLVIGLVRDRI